LPICTLASAEFSEYKKLIAYIAQKAIKVRYINLCLYCSWFALNPSSNTPFKNTLANNAIITYVAIRQEKGRLKANNANKIYSDNWNFFKFLNDVSIS